MNSKLLKLYNFLNKKQLKKQCFQLYKIARDTDFIYQTLGRFFMHLLKNKKYTAEYTKLDRYLYLSEGVGQDAIKIKFNVEKEDYSTLDLIAKTYYGRTGILSKKKVLNFGAGPSEKWYEKKTSDALFGSADKFVRWFDKLEFFVFELTEKNTDGYMTGNELLVINANKWLRKGIAFKSILNNLDKVDLRSVIYHELTHAGTSILAGDRGMTFSEIEGMKKKKLNERRTNTDNFFKNYKIKIPNIEGVFESVSSDVFTDKDKAYIEEIFYFSETEEIQARLIDTFNQFEDMIFDVVEKIKTAYKYYKPSVGASLRFHENITQIDLTDLDYLAISIIISLSKITGSEDFLNTFAELIVSEFGRNSSLSEHIDKFSIKHKKKIKNRIKNYGLELATRPDIDQLADNFAFFYDEYYYRYNSNTALSRLYGRLSLIPHKSKKRKEVYEQLRKHRSENFKKFDVSTWKNFAASHNNSVGIFEKKPSVIMYSLSDGVKFVEQKEEEEGFRPLPNPIPPPPSGPFSLDDILEAQADLGNAFGLLWRINKQTVGGCPDVEKNMFKRNGIFDSAIGIVSSTTSNAWVQTVLGSYSSARAANSENYFESFLHALGVTISIRGIFPGKSISCENLEQAQTKFIDAFKEQTLSLSKDFKPTSKMKKAYERIKPPNRPNPWDMKKKFNK